MISFKNKRFSLLHSTIFASITILVTFWVTSFLKEKQFTSQTESTTPTYACNYNVKRMDGYKFIKPLMSVDTECESEDLANTKQKVMSIIDRYKSIGDVNNASVYLREYDNKNWMCINEEGKYDPGSLIKVPVLITILKMNELNPGFLNKSILFTKSYNIGNVGKKIFYTSKTIQLGHTYTVRELLTYMIKYSDNNATLLLEANMSEKLFQKLFAEVGLEAPHNYDTQYQFTTKQFSYFMECIFNSFYLSPEASEFGAELLSQCDFKEGILKGLPANSKVAHKFAETGTLSEIQLHESGIVYLNNKIYLLTIMTRGKDNKKLSQLIGEISQAVYLDMHSQEITI